MWSGSALSSWSPRTTSASPPPPGDHQKPSVTLRAPHPSRIVETLITPASIHLCFVERHAAPETRVAVTHAPEALPIVAANTAYWNDAARLEHNTITLHHLLRIASLHRLYLGADPGGIIPAGRPPTNEPPNRPATPPNDRPSRHSRRR